MEENKNKILCGVNTFRKRKEAKLRENLREGSFGTVPGPILTYIEYGLNKPNYVFEVHVI